MFRQTYPYVAKQIQIWDGQKRNQLKKGGGPTNRRPFSASAQRVSREKRARRGIQGRVFSRRELAPVRLAKDSYQGIASAMPTTA
jgi:hypothetical protein